MRKLLVLVFFLTSTQVFAFGAITNAFNNIATSASSAGASGSSASTDTTKRDKIIKQAQNDAASFVGSNGKIRGIYLEQALEHLRVQYPDIRKASDLALAQAILAY